jgi:cytochrome b pre-mRNA-processing protein 3
MMLQFRRHARADIVDALYGAIVAQARHPAFYQTYGVPDTVDGRFDMLLLHLVLFCRCVRESAHRPLGQQVFDRFCRDMDHSLREMGVSDQAVPRRMRAIGEAFYGRAARYEVALAAEDAEPLAAALARNVFGAAADETPPGARRLAAYAREAARRIALQVGLAPAAAALQFPDPELIFAGQSSPNGRNDEGSCPDAR